MKGAYQHGFANYLFGWVMVLVERYYMDFLRGLGVTLELAIIGTIWDA